MSTLPKNDANNVIAFRGGKEAAQARDAIPTSYLSQAEFAKVSQDWPLSRFVEIFNALPGHAPVKKFENRQKAVARLWKAVQPSAQNPQPVEPCEPTRAPAGVPEPSVPLPESGRGRKHAKETKSTHKADSANSGGQPTTDRPNKKAQLIALMKRPQGVTLAEIMEATGWQKHTVRGFVSILGSHGGERIESSKNSAGDRIYKLLK
jgi:Protein of unknown function (DUF3489)